MATRAEMIEWAVQQLEAGLLPSTLPTKLMEKFNLRTATAQRITTAAIKLKQYQQDKGSRR